ncbi:tetratricopeptide repeat protein [Lentzea sp. JNUCC 0626]|uniref:tetratricopeptide repeat protein n=1 Tax=Lentzea sp. JNUCC 0626 TaxID=3367513 RepID=UPI0037493825
MISFPDLPGRPGGAGPDTAVAWRGTLTLDTPLPRRASRFGGGQDRGAHSGTAPALWEAVHLENGQVHAVVLPGAGGRVLLARDLKTGLDFLPPAGLSGTDPLADSEIQHEMSGAVTVWCSRHDRSTGLKRMHGWRLRPGSRVLELLVRVYNRTERAHPLVWDDSEVTGDHPAALGEESCVHGREDHPARTGTTVYPGETVAFLSWWFCAADGQRRDAEPLAQQRTEPPSILDDARAAYDRGEWRMALELLTRTPDIEACYYLGLVWERLGRPDKALDPYRAALRQGPWSAAARYRLACHEARSGHRAFALSHVDMVLEENPSHLEARALKAILLRRAKANGDADLELAVAMHLDPMHWWVRHLAGLPLDTTPATCLEVALHYADVGEWDSAAEVFETAAERDAHRGPGLPSEAYLAYRHLASMHERLGRWRAADQALVAAEQADVDDAFPVRLDDLPVLEREVEANVRVVRLRGQWYSAHGRIADAIATWTSALVLDPDDPVIWRNLGMSKCPSDARVCYDHALRLAGGDLRLVWESDRVNARLGVEPKARLAALLTHDLRRSHELTLVVADLLLTTGQVRDASALLQSQEFGSPQRAVLRVWLRACLLRVDAGDERAFLDALAPPWPERASARDLVAVHLAYGDLVARDDPVAAQGVWERAVADTSVFAECSEETFALVLVLRRLGRDDEARVERDRLRRLRDDLVAEPVAEVFPPVAYEESPVVLRDRRVSFLSAQLDLLNGDLAAARDGLSGVLRADPGHALARDLLGRIADEIRRDP